MKGIIEVTEFNCTGRTGKSGAISLIKIPNNNGSQLFHGEKATWRQESIYSGVGHRTCI